jgi:hypothetical protein
MSAIFAMLYLGLRGLTMEQLSKFLGKHTVRQVVDGEVIENATPNMPVGAFGSYGVEQTVSTSNPLLRRWAKNLGSAIIQATTATTKNVKGMYDCLLLAHWDNDLDAPICVGPGFIQLYDPTGKIPALSEFPLSIMVDRVVWVKRNGQVLNGTVEEQFRCLLAGKEMPVISHSPIVEIPSPPAIKWGKVHITHCPSASKKNIPQATKRVLAVLEEEAERGIHGNGFKHTKVYKPSKRRIKAR